MNDTLPAQAARLNGADTRARALSPSDALPEQPRRFDSTLPDGLVERDTFECGQAPLKRLA
eukprot:9075141-Pyramimonas_sp.AAC.1